MVKQVPRCCGIEMEFSYRVRKGGVCYDHFICSNCMRKEEVHGDDKEKWD